MKKYSLFLIFSIKNLPVTIVKEWELKYEKLVAVNANLTAKIKDMGDYTITLKKEKETMEDEFEIKIENLTK